MAPTGEEGPERPRERPIVGKRTLTEMLPAESAPVQRKAFSGTSASAVHASAQRGLATASSRLPHLDAIQRLFGRHDISGIEAHTGAEASASARAMGAHAYATGNHVVLGDHADLHTAAHEAAHVVQQRAGVHLKDRVGEVGDAHERHADAVADRVVRGESAEDLLDAYAGSRATTATTAAGAVQCKSLLAPIAEGSFEDKKRIEIQLMSGGREDGVRPYLAKMLIEYMEIFLDYKSIARDGVAPDDEIPAYVPAYGTLDLRSGPIPTASDGDLCAMAATMDDLSLPDRSAP